jgi:hypothetical protein
MLSDASKIDRTLFRRPTLLAAGGPARTRADRLSNAPTTVSKPVISRPQQQHHSNAEAAGRSAGDRGPGVSHPRAVSPPCPPIEASVLARRSVFTPRRGQRSGFVLTAACRTGLPVRGHLTIVDGELQMRFLGPFR